MEIVRFLTAGNVDDGKSTLIGRLLYETKNIKKDRLAKVTQLSGVEAEDLNYALFTDGLRAEREQGITIDVSYQYFSTDTRRFIIADCPGHREFTRNMITGASNCNAIVLMLHVQNGITEQTQRHFNIARLLGIKQLIVCVNKMDLVSFSQDAFESVVAEFYSILAPESDFSCHFIPTSATLGDSITKSSKNMTWYEGPTVLEVLNTFKPYAQNTGSFYFPVQHVLNHDYQLYCLGNVADGQLNSEIKLKKWPKGDTVSVKGIFQADKEVETLQAGEFGSIVLNEGTVIQRGDCLVDATETVAVKKKLDTRLCWLDEISPNLKQTYLVKCHTSLVNGILIPLNKKEQIEQNTIFSASIELNEGIVALAYHANKAMGAFVLIDPLTHHTVAAGIIA